MYTGISKGLVNRSVRYAAELNLIYLNNPKAGCSTVKFSLWTAIDALTSRQTFAGNVHARKLDPFVRDIFALGPAELVKFSAASMFSVVRNPFSRALAAYLDKIPDDPPVWTVFHERFGLRPDLTKEEFLFEDFLRLIDVAPPDLLDGHFRSQAVNLLQPYAKPSFVGHLEDMKPVEQYLAAFGVVLLSHVPRATKSVDRLGVYCSGECVELIRKVYAEDFALLGYSTDPKDVKMPGRSAPGDGDGNLETDTVRRWVVAGETPIGAVSDLADLRAFERIRGREHKRQIIATTFARDNDWSRLWRYAKYAHKRLEERELSEVILEKMASLRGGYERVVRKPDIFLPMRGIGRRR